MQGGYAFKPNELKSIVDTCLHDRRAKLPDQVSSVADFLSAVGLQNQGARGLSTVENPKEF